MPTDSVSFIPNVGKPWSVEDLAQKVNVRFLVCLFVSLLTSFSPSFFQYFFLFLVDKRIIILLLLYGDNYPKAGKEALSLFLMIVFALGFDSHRELRGVKL